MTARVAVATIRYDDPWDDVSVFTNRLAGALACSAEVDVLVPAAVSSLEVAWDGACRLLRFPAAAADARIRAAWHIVALGGKAHQAFDACTCPTKPRELPPAVEEQLVLAEGGDSPALYEHIRTSPYDAVVFVGLHSPVAYFGMRALADDRRAFLVPGGVHECVGGLKIHQATMARAEKILVCTEGEGRRMVDVVGAGWADRVENIGFVLGVNAIVAPETPGLQPDRFVVVGRDWRTSSSRLGHRGWLSGLADALPPGVGLRLVGPGASRLPAGVPDTAARIDAWWWMSRAVAVVDPAPHRVVGQEVLEAMRFAVPVVVAANGGASREHAEMGNGGLWFRVRDELVAAVERLLDEDVRGRLGEQGRSYAAEAFGDTDTFVKRVAEVLLG